MAEAAAICRIIIDGVPLMQRRKEAGSGIVPNGNSEFDACDRALVGLAEWGFMIRTQSALTGNRLWYAQPL